MSTPNYKCAGLLTVTAASSTATGSSSPDFITEVSQFIAGGSCFVKFIDNGGIFRCFKVLSVESDSSLTLSAVAPAGSTATAVAFYSSDTTDTYLVKGTAKTGTMSSSVPGATGTGTAFTTEFAVNGFIGFVNDAGGLYYKKITAITDNTHIVFDSTNPSSGTITAKVPKAVTAVTVTGSDGEIYNLGAGSSIFVPGPACAAAVAAGAALIIPPGVASPPAAPPSNNPLMIPPSNASTPYDVIGSDGVAYHLQPYSDAGTYKLTVPRMAYNAAIAVGWTIFI